MAVEVLFEHLNISKSIASLKIEDVWDEVIESGIHPNHAYLTCNGKICEDSSNHDLQDGAKVRVKLRLLGGKGGFGSMLRAIGAQIEKTTNREACRDLSGRRLRDINEEKRLKAWLEKQKIEPEDPDEKFKKKIGKLLAKPKHEFKDEVYQKERTDLTERLDEAVEQGFKKAQEIEQSRGIKRPPSNGKDVVKRTKGAVWTGLEDASSDSGADSDSSEEDFSPDDPTMEKIINMYLKDREKDLTKDETSTSEDQDKSKPEESSENSSNSSD